VVLDKTIKVNDFGQELNAHLKTESGGTINYGGAFYWSDASDSAFDDQDENSFSAYIMENFPLNRFATFPGLWSPGQYKLQF